MKAAPPKLAETIVALLIPPACREHVLGDLYERYKSPQQYVWDALSTVPSVILSQILRTTDLRVFASETFALYLSFLAAAWRIDGVPFLLDQGFLRLAIPTVAASVALVLARAYATRRNPILQPVFAVCSAFLAQSVLLAVKPDLALSLWTLLAGACVSVLLLSAIQAQDRGGAAMLPHDLQQRSREFEKNVRRANLELLLGVLILVFLGWRAAIAEPVSDRVAGGLIIAAALYITYQVFKRGSAGAVPPEADLSSLPALYRSRLERRRDALRSIWSWYVLPFLGGLMIFALRVPLAHPDQLRLWPNVVPFATLCIVWSFAMRKFSERAARKLQDEIDALR
jgi:hypothetical protein